jgi:hypothetical protein
MSLTTDTQMVYFSCPFILQQLWNLLFLFSFCNYGSTHGYGSVVIKLICIHSSKGLHSKKLEKKAQYRTLGYFCFLQSDKACSEIDQRHCWSNVSYWSWSGAIDIKSLYCTVVIINDIKYKTVVIIVIINISSYPSELNVRKPLIVSTLQRGEELRLHNLV